MRYAGKSGALFVDIAGAGAAPVPVVNTAKWTVDHSTATLDVTAMGDTNKQYVADIADFKGTFAGFKDTGANTGLYAAATDGKARGFYLYSLVPTNYWFGTAFFSESSSGGAGESVGVSGTITAAGPITQVPA